MLQTCHNLYKVLATPLHRRRREAIFQWKHLISVTIEKRTYITLFFVWWIHFIWHFDNSCGIIMVRKKNVLDCWFQVHDYSRKYKRFNVRYIVHCTPVPGRYCVIVFDGITILNIKTNETGIFRFIMSTCNLDHWILPIQRAEFRQANLAPYISSVSVRW